MKLPRVQSSVRALMALVLALGVGLGWFVHRAQVQRDAVAAILRAGGRVSYDWQWNNGRRIAKAKPRWPGWLECFSGEPRPAPARTSSFVSLRWTMSDGWQSPRGSDHEDAPFSLTNLAD